MQCYRVRQVPIILSGVTTADGFLIKTLFSIEQAAAAAGAALSYRRTAIAHLFVHQKQKKTCCFFLLLT